MPIFTAAFLVFALQADGEAAPAGGAVSHGANALMDMLSNMGGVALGVLVVLLLASLYSWTIILGKMATFKKATNESRRFIRTFRKASRLQEIATLIPDFKDSPLAQVFEDVYETYKRQTGGSGPPRNIAPLERSAQTASSEAVTALERRLTWLATIAATSPFVGLFGTVIGVVDAFHGLGTAGAATLRAVAPGISEALITTAAGLFVAVPAVVAYNQFAARLKVFASAIDDFSRELLNSLEEMYARPAAAAGQPQRTPGDAINRELPARDLAPEVERGLYK
jgi:biopolymer transport protein TolQ